ncbi:MAG: hypothetical protein IPN20_00880 [Haliscomenobacter sp.]|nr:hypothetical protein [Haliscomenobacter sp.]MBK8652509.1 hypothetical protein [Haliscomenobacter sp.]MBP9872836.1 hypothetical protein [Haliscomenobacter sp.]
MTWILWYYSTHEKSAARNPEKPLILNGKHRSTMRITIEAVDILEVEKIIFLLKSLNIKSVEVTTAPVRQSPSITKGNKTIDPAPLFGLWEDDPRSIEAIRAANWKRAWNA